MIEQDLPLRRSGASRQSLGVELRKSVVTNELSRLMARGSEGLVSRSRGVEAIRSRVGGSVRVAGSHFD